MNVLGLGLANGTDRGAREAGRPRRPERDVPFFFFAPNADPRDDGASNRSHVTARASRSPPASPSSSSPSPEHAGSASDDEPAELAVTSLAGAFGAGMDMAGAGAAGASGSISGAGRAGAAGASDACASSDGAAVSSSGGPRFAKAGTRAARVRLAVHRAMRARGSTGAVARPAQRRPRVRGTAPRAKAPTSG